MDDQEYVDEINFQPCRHCGRNFRPDVLMRHMPICAKSQQKKRKVFESGKQRASGSDIPMNKVLKPGEVPKMDSRDMVAKARTKNWRNKHESFIKAMRDAKEYKHAVETGGPLPPPPAPTINPDFVQCPYCTRRFNEKAADRHIPFCKDKTARVPTKGPPPSVVSKVATRTQYQPPQLKPQPRGGAVASPPRSQVPPPRNGIPQRTLSSGSSAGGGGGGGGGGSFGPRGDSGYANNSNSANRGMRNSGPVASSIPTRGGYGSNAPASRPPPPAAPVGPSRDSSGGSGRGAMPLTRTSKAAAAVGMSRFCHECGSKFPTAAAKFCAECGTKKVN